MKKGTIGLIIILAILSACTNTNLVPDEKINKIVVTKTSDNTKYQFTNKENIQLFEDTFRDVRKVDGVLDIRKQDYDVVFYFDDHQEKTLWMWLSEESGLAMNPNNTHVGYDLNVSNVEALRNLDWSKYKMPPEE
ncbi:hypothetical protein [Salinibacillus xinjiangensis]|uniref:YhfM-like domain-containing protein n=1 Tax=Salinibacillus xinjiangensis TaxID=1229268 RepID=A0A6G1X988_9BACI|nr:hypothetical protein [Salinibacillus xinjiangensis]MRG87507.1 hypothetical protein [Salinibacillus xinjiangensis]